MSELSIVILWVHVVAAAVWVGGIIFAYAVVGLLRESGEIKRQTLSALNSRLRNVTWLAVVALLITGPLNLHFGGYILSPSLLEVNPWVFAKTGLVVAMVGVKALHDFFVGPRAARGAEGGAWWNLAKFLGRLNLGLGLLTLYVALRL